ncbi:MAG: D-inositol-3-phosphate glycosyltransferase [Actinomycetota bacterium]|nr:D-inositol-3-phosphate glycosyltransferase [Actinomycetota bacterium]
MNGNENAAAPRDARRTVVGLLAGPNLGPGDVEVLDALECAAARGWTVRVAGPVGPTAAASGNRNLEYTSVPDLEPWAPSRFGTTAARRRADRGADALRAAVADADVIVTASLDAASALSATATSAPSARAKVAWLAAEPVSGRRARALLADVAPSLDLALTSGRVTTAAAEAAAIPVARVGDAQAVVVADQVIDAIDVLTSANGHRETSGNRRSVVFAVPDFEPTIGGTTRQSRNQAEALAARGGAVTIVTQRLDRSWPRRERSGAVTVRRLGPMHRDSTAMKLLVLRLAWWLRRHRSSIDLVQVIMYPDFVLSAWFAGLSGRTVMCWAGLGDATDVLGPTRLPVRAAARAVRRRVMRRTTHVALTPAMHDELIAVGIDNVAVIPTPVDLDAFHPPTSEERSAARRDLGIADGQFAVVYTGHLRALKRVDRLVDGFASRVRAGADARLFLVGDSRADLDDRRAALRAQVTRAGLDDRVVFSGAVPDVRPYLYAADVFVLPSDREGLPNSLLEAMACGLACVAPASAAGDQVLDTESGVIPPSNDPHDLAAALAALEHDPEQRARLGLGARRAAQRYGLEAVIDRYETLYRACTPGP